MYKAELSSVLGESSHAACRIPTEGAGMGTMGCRRVCACTFDVENNADCCARLVNKTPVFPVGDDWVVRAI